MTLALPPGHVEVILPPDRTALLAEALALAEALRLPHLIVDGDCWYSCPKSGDCCNDSRDGSRCDCGADKHNEKVDRLRDVLCRILEREGA